MNSTYQSDFPKEIISGSFVRQDSSFRKYISKRSEFIPDPKRYHIYLSYACPWAHRVLITLKLKELDTRWDYDDPNYENGIAETFSIDQSKHSLFGASKVAADIMVQEYGRYFGMATCCLRGGCLTGPSHSGVELHGFLSYLVKCNLQRRSYNIFGYKGKQVRDNIHAEDVVRFIELFIKTPSLGEVYNIGGGSKNSCSILEAFSICEEYSGKKQSYEYSEENRIGDHICYYSNLGKIKSHYPKFSITHTLPEIVQQIVQSNWHKKR